MTRPKAITRRRAEDRGRRAFFVEIDLELFEEFAAAEKRLKKTGPRRREIVEEALRAQLHVLAEVHNKGRRFG